MGGQEPLDPPAGSETDATHFGQTVQPSYSPPLRELARWLCSTLT